MTEACIVGWAHSPFGKLDDPDVESLIGRVAGAAIADAGIAANEIDASFVEPVQQRLLGAGLPRLAGAAACARPALQAGDAIRECLRLGLGRRAWRARLPRRRTRAVRAGGRRREDDRDAGQGGRRQSCSRPATRKRKATFPPVSPACSAGSPSAISNATAINPTRSPRSPRRTTRTASPTPTRRCAATSATSSAARSARRTPMSRRR